MSDTRTMQAARSILLLHLLLLAGAGYSSSLLCLDTLAGPSTDARARTQAMTDVNHVVEVAVAVPAVPPNWRCTGPLVFTPAWCATHSSSEPADVRTFQVGLFPGDRRGPFAQTRTANTRFNMALSNASFPHVPLCDANDTAAAPAPLAFSVPLFNGSHVDRDLGGADAIYWLVAYGIAPAARNASDASENRLLWSILDQSAEGVRPESVLRDRNDYYGRGWINWVPLSAWDARTRQVQARVELLGCAYTGAPTTEPVPVAAPEPGAGAPVPVAAPEPGAGARIPEKIETSTLIIVVVASCLVFIPLLIGLLFLIRFLRRRSRLASNKYSFRESHQGGSIYRMEAGDGSSGNSSMEDTSKKATPLIDLSASGRYKRTKHGHHHRRRTASRSSSSSGSGADLEGPDGAAVTWIKAEHIMFPVPLDGQRLDASSGSESPALVSREEDEETLTAMGTPRANVILIESSGSSGSSNGHGNARSEGD